MATKTEIKVAQIPDDVKKYVDIVIEELKRKIATGDFTIEVTYDNIAVKIPDIKAYVSKNRLYIIYKDIDIVYNDYVVIIKVWKDIYSDPEIYKAHDRLTALHELHSLTVEKVKERLEKAISKL
jgi:hypothetical protein